MEELIERASFLWRTMLADGKFDNGDDSNSGALGQILHGMAKETITKEQLDNFEKNLSRKIKEKLEKDLKEYGRTFYISLCTDYHPDTILSESAEEAGISERNFPVKSNLYLKTESNTISVRYGYSAQEETHYLQDGKWLAISQRDFIEKYVSHKFDGTEMPNVEVCGSREWPMMGIKQG